MIHDSTSALVIVRPTTVTTGPIPELPCDAPATTAPTLLKLDTSPT